MTTALRAGLVSVTLRRLSPADVVVLAGRAELTAIEWGGDVHVPHGDLHRAREVRAMTTDAGLEVAAYGSYCRLAESDAGGPAFDAVVETAAALGAPLIRVWAGRRGSADADSAYRGRVVADSHRFADIAETAGIAIAYEFHPGTLTDTSASARRLLTEVDHPNVGTLWQPPPGEGADACVAGLTEIRPWLCNLHVFHWWPEASDRRPLAEGADRWRRYLRIAAGDPPRRYALLEFVRDDDPAALFEDAASLRTWLGEIGSG